jgi:voltage-gated potassium channel
LLALLALLIGSPFFGTTVLSRVAVALLLSILLFATVILATNAPHQRWIAAILATVCGVILFAGLWLEHRVIYLPVVALLTIYLAYTIAVVLYRIVVATEIDADILCGTVAIYLLIGVVWALTYWPIYEFDEGAFAAASSLSAQPYDLHRFLYYSFSNLTSLGIGDITPVNRFAQIWTTLETATGNLYIAVLVARLVSLYR